MSIRAITLMMGGMLGKVADDKGAKLTAKENLNRKPPRPWLSMKR